MLDVAIAQRAGECYDRQEDQVDAAQAEVDGLIDQAQTRHVDVQVITFCRKPKEFCPYFRTLTKLRIEGSRFSISGSGFDVKLPHFSPPPREKSELKIF